MRDSPSGAASDYLAAACEGRLRDMRRATQRSYDRSFQKTRNKAKRLGKLVGAGPHHPLREHLVKFSIVDVTPISDVMVDVHVRLWVRTDDETIANDLGLFRLRTICEDREGRPSIDGRWGVNPASLRTIDESDVEDDDEAA